MGDVDVRDPSMVKDLQKLLASKKIVVILVYADWCGHCHTYRDTVWNKMTAIPKGKRKNGLAAIQAEQLQHTPFANAKLKGFPSVLVVGKDGHPAEFKDENGDSTNALPDARNTKLMNTIVTSDPELPDGSALGPNGRNEPFVSNRLDSLLSKSKTVLPPETEKDILSTSSSEFKPTEINVDKTLMKQGGGSLFQSLWKATRKGVGRKRRTTTRKDSSR